MEGTISGGLAWYVRPINAPSVPTPLAKTPIKLGRSLEIHNIEKLTTVQKNTEIPARRPQRQRRALVLHRKGSPRTQEALFAPAKRVRADQHGGRRARSHRDADVAAHAPVAAFPSPGLAIQGLDRVRSEAAQRPVEQTAERRAEVQ